MILFSSFALQIHPYSLSLSKSFKLVRTFRYLDSVERVFRCASLKISGDNLKKVDWKFVWKKEGGGLLFLCFRIKLVWYNHMMIMCTDRVNHQKVYIIYSVLFEECRVVRSCPNLSVYMWMCVCVFVIRRREKDFVTETTLRIQLERSKLDLWGPLTLNFIMQKK